jgi:hypothetical protein
MSPATYFLAGVGPAGLTEPVAYPSKAIARHAVVVALEGLVARYPGEANTIARALELLDTDPSATVHLDYMTLRGRQFVIFYGPR